MGIVRFALRFPHTFYVVAALIMFLGVVACVEMPTDIFPEINIPVVTVIWSYTGLSTPEMEQRVTTYSQYSISSNVTGIRNIEAQTMAGLSELDVVNAVNAQNLTLPAGTAKFGRTQYVVRTNATPATIDDLNDIPIKVVNGATVFVKDVGQVHDGWLVQQNVVRQNGRRSVLLSIIKNGNASTLSVVNAVHKALQVSRAAAPPGMQINELFDQSVFVKQSVMGVLREGAIAAALTALMILLFLGSWRSTLVVMISIPLSILSSLIALYFPGDTINTMTLGELPLPG